MKTFRKPGNPENSRVESFRKFETSSSFIRNVRSSSNAWMVGTENWKKKEREKERKQEPRISDRIAGRAERERDDKTQFELKTALL